MLNEQSAYPLCRAVLCSPLQLSFVGNGVSNIKEVSSCCLLSRKIEEDLKEEEGEIDPLEEVDLDPRKEKEDPMSPRRELLWQTMYVTSAQPEMQVTILRLQTS